MRRPGSPAAAHGNALGSGCLRDRHLEVVRALARTIGHDPNLQHLLFGARSPAHVCEILRHEAFEEINVHIDE